VLAALYILSQVTARRRRLQAGLPTGSNVAMLARIAVVVGGLLVATAVFNADRGLPVAIVIFVGFVVVFDFITRRTTFGRDIFAVGGNAEAARRAGINVNGVRLAVFVLGSTMAAAGGILLASRLLAVSQSSGGGDRLRSSVA